MARKHEVVWIDKGWQPVHIGYCPSKKAWKKFVKHVKDAPDYPQTPGGVTFFEGEQGDRSCIITFNFQDCWTPIEKHGLIVHEVVHVWQRVCEFTQETNPGMETEAYSIQALFQLVSKEVEKHGRIRD